MRSGLVVLLCTSVLSLSAGALSKGEQAANPKVLTSFSGNISWYGARFHGRKTASGEIFDMHKCTGAHRTLPFSTKVLVEDPRTGRAVILRVNDRGPFVKTRVMDVSREVARRLGNIERGTAFVDCLVVKEKNKRDAAAQNRPAALDGSGLAQCILQTST